MTMKLHEQRKTTNISRPPIKKESTKSNAFTEAFKGLSAEAFKGDNGDYSPYDEQPIEKVVIEKQREDKLFVDSGARIRANLVANGFIREKGI